MFRGLDPYLYPFQAAEAFLVSEDLGETILRMRTYRIMGQFQEGIGELGYAGKRSRTAGHCQTSCYPRYFRQLGRIS